MVKKYHLLYLNDGSTLVLEGDSFKVSEGRIQILREDKDKQANKPVASLPAELFVIYEEGVATGGVKGVFTPRMGPATSGEIVEG